MIRLIALTFVFAYLGSALVDSGSFESFGAGTSKKSAKGQKKPAPKNQKPLDPGLVPIDPSGNTSIDLGAGKYSGEADRSATLDIIAPATEVINNKVKDRKHFNDRTYMDVLKSK